MVVPEAGFRAVTNYERNDSVNDALPNEIRMFYTKTFATIRGIVDAFPEDKWLQPHGCDYYLPSRIAYHLAVVIDGQVAGGSDDPDFRSKLPYGLWMEATAETLPNKQAFITYLNEVIERADQVLNSLNSENLFAPADPERPWRGSSQLSVLIYCLREIAAHTGELNKMLIENGIDDVWVYR